MKFLSKSTYIGQVGDEHGRDQNEILVHFDGSIGYPTGGPLDRSISSHSTLLKGQGPLVGLSFTLIRHKCIACDATPVNAKEGQFP